MDYYDKEHIRTTIIVHYTIIVTEFGGTTFSSNPTRANEIPSKSKPPQRDVRPLIASRAVDEGCTASAKLSKWQHQDTEGYTAAGQ